MKPTSPAPAMPVDDAERLASVLRLSSDWYWEQDAELRFTRFVGGDAQHLGQEDVRLGRRRWEVPGTVFAPAALVAHRRDLDARRPFRDFVYRATLVATGELRFVSTSGEPVYDAEGCFAGYRGVSRDVTDRERAVRLVECAGEVLEHLADGTPLLTVLERLCAGMEALLPVEGCMAILACGAGGPLAAAPNVPRRLGLALAHASRAAHGPDAPQALERGWAAVDAVARTSGLGASWCVPVVGEDGVPVGVLGVFYSLPREPGTADRDLALRAVRLARLAIQRRADEGRIRELNEDLERRVESRTRELQASLRELESFSYTISHDLRTPLRAIDGYVHILLEDHGPGLDAVARDRLEKVSGGARRMAQLIDGLLAFSRVPRAHFADEQVDMAALVNAALDELAPIRGRARIVVGRLPRAHGDAMLLRQVWTNLIANALKFSAQRNEPLVEIGADDAGDETVYHVRDNGVGFEQQYAGKLFGVFERLHGVQEFDGVGVGLAIVARIVHRHGGRTWAEGRLDAGATFRFALPARPGSTPE